MEEGRMCSRHFDVSDNSPKLDSFDFDTTSNRSFQFRLWGEQQINESTKKQVSGKAYMRNKLCSGKSAHSLGELVAFWLSLGNCQYWSNACGQSEI